MNGPRPRRRDELDCATPCVRPWISAFIELEMIVEITGSASMNPTPLPEGLGCRIQGMKNSLKPLRMSVLRPLRMSVLRQSALNDLNRSIIHRGQKHLQKRV